MRAALGMFHWRRKTTRKRKRMRATTGWKGTTIKERKNQHSVEKHDKGSDGGFLCSFCFLFVASFLRGKGIG
jgi:hypothetical protein